MKVKPFLAHRLNPLHVYCRLRDLGLSIRQAKGVGRLYEKGVRVLVTWIKALWEV